MSSMNGYERLYQSSKDSITYTSDCATQREEWILEMSARAFMTLTAVGIIAALVAGVGGKVGFAAKVIALGSIGGMGVIPVVAGVVSCYYASQDQSAGKENIDSK